MEELKLVCMRPVFSSNSDLVMESWSSNCISMVATKASHFTATVCSARVYPFRLSDSNY